MQSLPHSFFDQNPSGAIVSRVLNDVQQANELVGSVLIDVWMDAVSLTLVVAALLMLNWHLALVALCISPLWVAFMRFFSPRIKSVSHRMQETVEEIAGEVHERVAGASTIKSFCREDYEVRAIPRPDRAPARTHDRQGETRRAPGNADSASDSRRTDSRDLGRCALMIIRGTMTLGTMVAFFSYLGFLYLPLERFAQLSVVVSASMAAIERIFGFLDLKPEITDHALSRPFAVRNGTVQFDDVSFGYRLAQWHVRRACPRESQSACSRRLPRCAGRPIRRRQNDDGQSDSALL